MASLIFPAILGQRDVYSPLQQVRKLRYGRVGRFAQVHAARYTRVRAQWKPPAGRVCSASRRARAAGRWGPGPAQGLASPPSLPFRRQIGSGWVFAPIRTRLAGARGGSGGSVHDGVRAGREKPQRLAAVGLWGLNRPSLQEKAPLPLTTLFRARAHNGF